MIISASRRTDIPAFYSKWFFNRIKEGFVLVRNPLNFNQVSKITLNPKVVDCIVLWSKNPRPMLKRLEELKDYRYYFQFTINSYDKSIEPNVPGKRYIIKTFIDLSKLIGRERVIWRYDPIMLTDIFNKEYHYKWFEYLAERLHDYTNKCVISFLDVYKKTERNLKNIKITPLSKSDMEEIAYKLSSIASKYNLILESCSEEIDLSKDGIEHGKCIDDRLISRISGCNLKIDKDPNQREICGCVKSIDIGTYNTCGHGCLYCYANFSKERVRKQLLEYDSKSPLLIGRLNGNEKITNRKVKSYFECEKQIKFL